MLLSFSRAGQLPLGKIGQRLQVHPASVTNAIDRLERDGFVTRGPHPTDGRATLARITDAGSELAHAAVLALNREVFSDVGLADAGVTTLIDALATLRSNAGDFDRAPDL